MNFIIGGAYQGKLDCARIKYNLTEAEILTCTEEHGIEFGGRCIDKIEEFTLWCVRNGKDAAEIFRENHDKWTDSVLICMDIFCGVVPLGADMRAWRDMTGWLCAYLSSEADSVTRMFCGLEQRLK